MSTSNPSIDEVLFPGVRAENWQMMPCERIALTGILARLRPQYSIEIGVYHGGSISLTAQFVENIVGIDIDPAVPTRFTVPENVDIQIGNSTDLIPKILADYTAAQKPLSFVLVDGDHTAAGVKRDIELLLAYTPIVPMVIMIHDSGNPTCREGIKSADFNANPHVHAIDLDFVPGQIIEHAVIDGRGEVWGGLCLIYLSPALRQGDVVIGQGAQTTIRLLHEHMLAA